MMRLSIPFQEDKNTSGIFTFFNYILKRQLFSIYTITNSRIDNDPYLTTTNNTNDSFYWCSERDYPNITFLFNDPINLSHYTISNAVNHSYTNCNVTWYELDRKKVDFCGG